MSDVLFQGSPVVVSRVLILSILYERPIHGYGILEELEQRLGRKASPGFLYPFLRLLERRSLARHRNVRIGRKIKKVYELTPQGRRQSLAAFDRLRNILSKAIVPTLDTCSNCGCKIFEGGFEKRVGGLRTLFCCSHCAQASRRT